MTRAWYAAASNAKARSPSGLADVPVGVMYATACESMVSCTGAGELRFAARPATILEVGASADRLSLRLKFGGKSSDVKGLSESDVPAYAPRRDSCVGVVVVNLAEDVCCVEGACAPRSNTAQAVECSHTSRIGKGERVSVKGREGKEWMTG